MFICFCGRELGKGATIAPFDSDLHCRRCWLWLNQPKSKKRMENLCTGERRGRTSPITISSRKLNLPCIYRSEELVEGNILRELGLDTRKNWYICESPTHELKGNPVCTCQGCGKNCSGYSPRVNQFLQWIRIKDMSDVVIQKIIPKISSDCTGVCGVSRSGIFAASMISTMMHLPLYIVSAQEGDPVLQPTGDRGFRYPFKNNGHKKILVIDDTVYTGNLMKKLKERLGSNYVYSSVYACRETGHIVDFYGEDLASPHLLEWNMFNNGGIRHIFPFNGSGSALDFDGVICEDSPCPNEDSNPEDYRKWLIDKAPFHLPRALPVPLIVTGRLEKWRKETEGWLDKWGVRFDKLVMYPSVTGEERDGGEGHSVNVAKFKAKVFHEERCAIYFESCPVQSKIINSISGKPVICISTGKIFQDN